MENKKLYYVRANIKGIDSAATTMFYTTDKETVKHNACDFHYNMRYVKIYSGLVQKIQICCCPLDGKQTPEEETVLFTITSAEKWEEPEF